MSLLHTSAPKLQTLSPSVSSFVIHWLSIRPHTVPLLRPTTSQCYTSRERVILCILTSFPQYLGAIPAPENLANPTFLSPDWKLDAWYRVRNKQAPWIFSLSTVPILSTNGELPLSRGPRAINCSAQTRGLGRSIGHLVVLAASAVCLPKPQFPPNTTPTAA